MSNNIGLLFAINIIIILGWEIEIILKCTFLHHNRIRYIMNVILTENCTYWI